MLISFKEVCTFDSVLQLFYFIIIAYFHCASQYHLPANILLNFVFTLKDHFILKMNCFKNKQTWIWTKQNHFHSTNKYLVHADVLSACHV